MKIHNFYFNDNKEILNIEFSLINDDENSYRNIELNFTDVEFYSPTIIDITDMYKIDDEFIIELLEQYFMDNDYPEEMFL
jgi:hypothetical protein